MVAVPKHPASSSQTVWRPAAGLRLAVLLVSGLFVIAARAFFLHVFAHRGDNANFFHGRPENIVAGVAFAIGAAVTILWALRACLAVHPDAVVVQGPLRARRIPRDAIERVSAYGRGWLRIRYVAGGRTRYLTTGVTQGYLGIRLFGRETRSARAASCINELLGLSLGD
jgi:hypothetical protein